MSVHGEKQAVVGNKCPSLNAFFFKQKSLSGSQALRTQREMLSSQRPLREGDLFSVQGRGAYFECTN